MPPKMADKSKLMLYGPQTTLMQINLRWVIFRRSLFEIFSR
jgi:hypothetical protein